MNNKHTLSIIIPAYNEEKNIRAAVKSATEAVNFNQEKFSDYEIFLFDDCSKDKTGVIADELAESNPRIRVIHNKKNEGFAYNYKTGVELSNNDYIFVIPGDNEILEESVSDILGSVGKADIIIPYTINRDIRPLSRQLISFSFTFLMNLLFGLRLKYYNGPVVHKKELIKSISIKSKSFAFQAEALIKLIKRGCTFIEVGMRIRKREYGRSNLFRLNNIIGVFKTIVGLLKEIYLPTK